MGKDKRRYKDRAEYLIGAVKKRRRELKNKVIQYKGGKCVLCGYMGCIDALEFHHLDESKKNFGFSQKGITRSWEKIKEELEKCILVCANCHREIHAGLKTAASNGNIGVNKEVNSGEPK